MNDISVHRSCELTKRFLEMMDCDTQTSVLDIYKCLGVSYETVFKTCSVFYSGGTGEEGNYSSGPFKKV